VENDLTEIKEAKDALELKSKELFGLNNLLASERERLIATATELEKANNELIKLSRAKSEFVQAVSHELRTPLTAIMEGASLLVDGSLGSINQDQMRFLVLIKNNAKRLADLINDLLDLSKIEAGRYELNPVKLSLDKIIKELVANLGELVKEKGLTLNLTTDFSKLPPVLADERSVYRVLVNLLSNAVKFTQAGGQITISGALLGAIRDGQTLPSVVVTVADTGIGIPKDQQNKLFHKFQQITRPGETRPQGTGLGLALCKELIELNQGKIWVESEEGKGSKFMFSLLVYDEREDLKQTWERLLRDTNQAKVPMVVYLFKADLAKERETVLETMEKIIKSQTSRFEITKRLKSLGAVIVFNFTGHLSPSDEPKTDPLFTKLSDYLQGTTFLWGTKEIEVSISGSYYRKEPNENLTFDQLLDYLWARLKRIR
jgi:signal transduction histidine kinase